MPIILGEAAMGRVSKRPIYKNRKLVRDSEAAEMVDSWLLPPKGLEFALTIRFL